MDWDVKFHEFIIHKAGNKRLNMLFGLMLNQKRRFDLTSGEDEEHARLSTQQHGNILKAIESGDLEASKAAVREHTGYIKKYYINKLVTGKYNL
jgi:DNA-binding FadR family transcriptional regulator